jgi:two-component system, sensor histidine kinase PdtaS
MENEKQNLLNELQHRVKNNFNTILSMIKLQNLENKNCMECGQLDKLIHRISALSLSHKLLDVSKNQKSINCLIYFTQLINQIRLGYPNMSKIDIKTDIDAIDLDTKKTVNSGLVLNEILTNCFKYAFEGLDSGTINIILNRKNDKVHLVVEDNGIGLPEDFNLSKTSSLGMTLIQSIVRDQLGGSIKYVSEGGLKYDIRFSA